MVISRYQTITNAHQPSAVPSDEKADRHINTAGQTPTADGGEDELADDDDGEEQAENGAESSSDDADLDDADLDEDALMGGDGVSC